MPAPSRGQGGRAASPGNAGQDLNADATAPIDEASAPTSRLRIQVGADASSGKRRGGAERRMKSGSDQMHPPGTTPRNTRQKKHAVALSGNTWVASAPRSPLARTLSEVGPEPGSLLSSGASQSHGNAKRGPAGRSGPDPTSSNRPDSKGSALKV